MSCCLTSVVFSLVKHHVVKIRSQLGIFTFCTDNVFQGQIGGNINFKVIVNLDKKENSAVLVVLVVINCEKKSSYVSKMVLSFADLCFLIGLQIFFFPQIVCNSLDRANTLGDVLSRSCMYGFGISGLYSEYDVTTKDRLWRLNCTRIGFKGYDTCEWTSWYFWVIRTA